MISSSQNNTSATLRQGINFKKYQKKIINSVAKKSQILVEGFQSKTNNISNSNNLVSQVDIVQNHVQEMKELQNQFASVLQRYKVANTQLMSTTNTYLSATSSNDSAIGKNIFVNSIVSNPDADYIGAYNDNASKPAMSTLSQYPYTYEQCLNAAITSGNEYFGLGNVSTPSTTAPTTIALCSLSNDLNNVVQYGLNIPSFGVDSTDGNIYGGNSTNAIYFVNGSFGNTYLGSYKDNVSDRAMIPSGIILSNFTPVYTLGPSNISPWSISFVDNTAEWIWYSSNANVDAPNNVNSPVTLINSFDNNNTGYISAKIYCICDNISTVYLNSQSIGTANGGWENFDSSTGFAGIIFSVTIQPGTNYISASVENAGGPAGFLLSIIDSNNSVLINTNSSWKYTQLSPESLVPNNQNYSVASCQQYANNNGFGYMGLQGGKSGSSQCYVSNNLTQSQKYGSANSIVTGSDGKNYGTNLINAVYKVKELGYPNNMGNIGYINNDNTLSQYPSSMIDMSKRTIVDSDSSCSKDILNIDSIQWNNYTKISDMNSTTKCGLATEIQADKSSVSDLANQLRVISQKIITIITYLETLDSNIIKQVGINKESLNEMMNQYINNNIKFSQYKNFDSDNINNILSDTGIIVKQETYSYILWSVIAISIIITTFVLIKRN